MCSIDNALLIFRTNSDGNNKGYFDEVDAYLLKKNKVIETRIAYINELAELSLCNLMKLRGERQKYSLIKSQK